MSVIWVFIGGGLGAVLRFLLGWSLKSYTDKFPWTTLVSNVFASALLGLFLVLIRTKLQSSEAWNQFLIIGVCGGFSTFSSFAKENVELFERGQSLIAILNIVVNTLFCILAVWLTKRISL